MEQHPADKAMRAGTIALYSIITDNPRTVSKIHLAVIPGLGLQIIAAGIDATWSGYHNAAPHDEQPPPHRPLCGARNAGKLWVQSKKGSRGLCANCERLWHRMYRNAGWEPQNWFPEQQPYRNPRY